MKPHENMFHFQGQFPQKTAKTTMGDARKDLKTTEFGDAPKDGKLLKSPN